MGAFRGLAVFGFPSSMSKFNVDYTYILSQESASKH
jgi:hypothetical protein